MGCSKLIETYSVCLLSVSKQANKQTDRQTDKQSDLPAGRQCFVF